MLNRCSTWKPRLTTASDLKFTRVIQTRLAEWVSNPSEEVVRLLSADLLGGRRFTLAARDQFTEITKRAFDSLINERINERLKGAMTPDRPLLQDPAPPQSQPAAKDGDQIVTTNEEIEGFHIVRAILRDTVSPKRIVMRDAQSYCAILLDDNNRKPVCRLRFNNSEKLSVGLFNDKKEEERFSLSDVDDLYSHAEIIRATVLAYLPKEET